VAEQGRILRTAIPGPKSVKLQQQRTAELASGLGVTLPVFIDRAGGGILVDVDGNHLIDLASGIAVTSVGASDPDVARWVAEQAQRFTHTCFLVTEYEGFVDVASGLNRLTPGDHEKRTALFTTGAEPSRTRSRSHARTPAGTPSWCSGTPTTGARCSR
jgi:4-aminobutyrate aminotransferase/(S)-3-amino-2-methylpropionate transaminase